MEIFYTFPNTSTVIASEQALLTAKIPVKVRPVPNAIRAGCGLSLCVPQELKAVTEETLAANNLTFSEVYSFQDGRYTIL